MKQYYECHVTMMGNPNVIRPLVESRRWKFSAIDGDPSLGVGIKCYATHHFNTRMETEKVVAAVNILGDLLSKDGVDVIRRKVELVVYDDRSKTIAV